MTGRRIYISATLMTIAIIAIAFFQGYWLYKTYNEEKETLAIRTNLLFRESIFETQAAKFAIDTVNILNIADTKQAIRLIDNIKIGAMDSSSTRAPHVVGYGTRISRGDPRQVISVRRMLPKAPGLPDIDSGHDRFARAGTAQPDSTRIVAFNFARTRSAATDSGDNVSLTTTTAQRTLSLKRNAAVFYKVLEGVDLTQDSLTIPEISRQLKKSFDSESIGVGYTISKTTLAQGADSMVVVTELPNEVITGFSRPMKYALSLQDSKAYLLSKMSSQILVSALLVALTITSFVVLFRNLVRQRKLTELKNDFISNITHELKTPIATVSVAVEALKSFNALDDAKRTEEYLNISANELQRLSLLVDKVLRLSMFENQEIELKNESFDIRILAEEVSASMKLQFEKYGAIVKLDLPAEPVVITADRLHITSVIYNLLDNALKYSKGKPAINISIKTTGNMLELSVEDNGPGIANEYRDKIFEKFFRVPTGNQHNVKGYGLGLSYVAYVIDRHKGKIALQTAMGTGSTFKVTLPTYDWGPK